MLLKEQTVGIKPTTSLRRACADTIVTNRAKALKLICSFMFDLNSFGTKIAV